VDPAEGQTPLYDADGARAFDRVAIDERGVPGIDLMRAAGRASDRVRRGRFAGLRRVVVAAGPGQNGGDGCEVARLARAQGCAATVVRVAGRASTGDAARAQADAAAAGVPILERPDGAIGDDLAGADLVVDALLGTGAAGAPRDGIARAIEAIRASGLPVLALDLPSGVDAATGEAPGAAVQADCTVTYHCDKLGLRIEPGRSLAGAVLVAPIGIPTGIEVAPAGVRVASAAGLIEPRTATGSKYAAGAVLVIGGSVGMVGAPLLAAEAALRAGAGVVTVLVPDAVQATASGLLREAMVRPLGDDPAATIAAYAERAAAVVLGPGLGREAPAGAIVRAALVLERPLVVDADALWWCAADPAPLAARSAPTLITPHTGEAARLLDAAPAAVEARRLASARALAERTGAVALLKGADSLVLAPDGRLGVRAHACAALATAGSGDVLAGVAAACLARGADPWTAGIAAAALHVEAGRRAAARAEGGAIIAGDLIGCLMAPDRPGSPA
jgi:NAD(P)H-hydrate epimerase